MILDKLNITPFPFKNKSQVFSEKIFNKVKENWPDENLFKPFNELKSFLEKEDPELETDHEGITSHKLGIGVWYPHLAEEPENLPESIILFEDGYYTDSQTS